MLLATIDSHAQYGLQKSTWELHAGAGWRARINSKEGTFRSTISFNRNWRLSKFIDLKTGFDAIYWDVVYTGLANDPGYFLRSTSYDHWAYAIFIGGDFKMHRAIFQTGYGRYLYYNTLDIWNVKYYTKLGFRYQVTPHVSVGMFLRAHAYEADYMDFGIGYKF